MSAKYASLHNHVSSNKNAANGEFIFRKKFLFPHEVQKGVKELVLVIAVSFQQGEGNTKKAFKFLKGKNLSLSDPKNRAYADNF